MIKFYIVMPEHAPLVEDVPAEPATPQLDLAEIQPRMPLRERTWFRRTVASCALVGAVTTMAQPSLRMDAFRAAASTAANFIYNETPAGWSDQAFDAYVDHEAGWDNPVQTTIRTYDSPEHPTPQGAKVTNFVVPGFREMQDEEITGELVAATKDDCPTRYVAYGNQPVTPDSLAELIIHNLEEDPLKTPEIGFTGHSMGGVLLLEALARVHEMGYELPKVAFIDFLSTPAGMPTARFSGAADFFAKTGIGQKATGALITDVLQQMDAQHFHPAWYAHDVAKAWQDLRQGASDALTTSQLQDLDEIDSQQALNDLLMSLRGVISPDTKITYFAPINPASDTVVDDPASFARLSKPFESYFGITMQYVAWGSGHANTDIASNTQADQRFILSMGPIPAPKPKPSPSTSAAGTPNQNPDTSPLVNAPTIITAGSTVPPLLPSLAP